MSSHRRSIRTGGITLMAVFLVLCLTVFGVLSLASAQADARLCEKNAAQVKAYYEADAKAEEELRNLWRALRGAQAEAGNTEEFWRLIASAEGERFDPEERTVSYAVPVTAQQELRVRVRLTAPANGAAASCEILQWKTAVTVEYEIDNSLSVWDGK